MKVILEDIHNNFNGSKEIETVRKNYRLHIIDTIMCSPEKLAEADLKQSFIEPFLYGSGINIFDLRQCRKEHLADDVKNEKRCDYILTYDENYNNGPSIVIEAKKVGFNISKSGSVIDAYTEELPDRRQLSSYFAALQNKHGNSLKYGILTDGLYFYFYKKKENSSFLEEYPFYSFYIEDVIFGKSKVDCLLWYLFSRHFGTSMLDFFSVAAEKAMAFKKGIKKLSESCGLSEDSKSYKEGYASFEAECLARIYSLLPQNISDEQVQKVSYDVQLQSSVLKLTNDDNLDFVPISNFISYTGLTNCKIRALKIGLNSKPISVCKWTKCLPPVIEYARNEKGLSVDFIVNESKKYLGMVGMSTPCFFRSKSELICEELAKKVVCGIVYRGKLKDIEIIKRCIILQELIGVDIYISYVGEVKSSHKQGYVKSLDKKVDTNASVIDLKGANFISVSDLLIKDVEGNKPNNFKIGDLPIPCRSWRKLFGTTINYLYKNSNLSNVAFVNKVNKELGISTSVGAEFLFVTMPNRREDLIDKVDGAEIYFPNNWSAKETLPRLCVLKNAFGIDISINLLR